MTIAVGQSLPEVTFRIPTKDAASARTTSEIFKGRRVVLFAVPGAFTPTCQNNHLPGYLKFRDQFLAKGIHEIVVVSVNDVHVMKAWAQANDALDKIAFLADGSAEFTKAVGLVLDATAGGLGIRSLRYSMLVEDGVVKILNIEDSPGNADISGAAALITQI
ncbi:MAG: redoxin family protein [Hyphomicrobiales bacterium]|nr:redoxin family protein [Hyphomicrobiales bacterium]